MKKFASFQYIKCIENFKIFLFNKKIFHFLILQLISLEKNLFYFLANGQTPRLTINKCLDSF